MHEHINDPYVKLAQREGYRARAAYKLKEIDEQDGLIKAGMTVVDLGSAPGSWSQVAAKKIKPNGILVGVAHPVNTSSAVAAAILKNLENIQKRYME